MHAIYRNANEAFVHLYEYISVHGHDAGPRGMKTREINTLMLTIENPVERIITEPIRKFKVKAAIAEFLWYMTANPSANVIDSFIPRWKEFTNDLYEVNSNYGTVWKNAVPQIVKKIKKDRDTRQAIMTMYDSKYLFHPHVDTRDVPCTVSIQFLVRDDKLNIVVYMRSNDLWYGFCIDQFCFSYLQELVANELRMQIGNYTHIAASMHIYEDKLHKVFSYYKEEEKKQMNDITLIRFSKFWDDLRKELSMPFVSDSIALLMKEHSIDYNHFEKYIL